jgi:hypothetical protein
MDETTLSMNILEKTRIPVTKPQFKNPIKKSVALPEIDITTIRRMVRI